MGIKQVTGTRRPADFSTDRQATTSNPKLIIYSDGRAMMSVRCKDLLAVTGITDPEQVAKIVKASDGVKNPDAWTKEEVAALTRELGRMPFPRVIEMQHLEGKKSLLMWVTNSLGSSRAELYYAPGSNRPIFSATKPLQDEGIKVPKGMCLEVPVALVQDGNQLKVEAALLRGEERAVKKDEQSEIEGEEDED